MSTVGARRAWRHRRVWLEPRGLGGLCAHWSGAAADLQRLIEWADAGRPFVGRAAQRIDADVVPLGLALQPAAEKRRVSFTIARGAVVKDEPPLPLSEALRTPR